MREIRALTGIRGVACVVVMFYHYSDRRIGSGAVKTFIDHGYLALDLFFVLSGFVMALTYAGMFAGSFSLRAYGAFFGRRVARIYPIYLIVTLVMSGFVLANMSNYLTPHDLARIIVPNLLLIQVWIGQLSIDFPAWSVSAEWAAYVVFPFLLLLTMRASRGVAALTLIASLVALALVALLPGWTLVHPGRDGTLNVFQGFGTPLVRCFAEFILGLLACRVAQSDLGARLAGMPVVQPVVALLIVLGLAVPHTDLLLVPAFAVLIVLVSRDRGSVARLLGSPVAYALGEWSYSIYLLHPHAGRVSIALERAFRAHHVPHPVLLSLLPAMVLTIAAAAIVYPAIEKPGRRLIQRALSHPRKVATRGDALQVARPGI